MRYLHRNIITAAYCRQRFSVSSSSSSSSSSTSSFPLYGRSILSCNKGRPILAVVGGQQRCALFMMDSNNIMNSSSLYYPSFTTMTTTPSPSSKTTTTNNKQTNKATTNFLSSSNGTCMLGNIDEEDDDKNDNNSYSTAIEDDGQTIYIITAADNNQNEDHNNTSSSENNSNSNSNNNNNNNNNNISWGFSSPLLWVNDPQYIHPSSGQRVRTLGQYSKNIAIVSAEIINYHYIDGDNIDDNDSKAFPLLHTSPPRGSLHSRGGIYYHSKKSHGTTTTTNDKNGIKRTLLKIEWKSGEESIFDLNWLIENARNNCIGWMSKGLPSSSSSSSSSLKSSVKENKSNDDHDYVKVSYPITKRKKTTTTTTTSVTKDIAISANSTSIKTFDYQEIMVNENILFQGMQGIFENGVILIRNASTTTTTTTMEDNENTVSRAEEVNEVESIVGDLGKRFSGAKLSHGSLYGDIFHVQTKNDAKNIAYTNVALPPHQDLTYYESKPFLQLLHCVTDTTNDNNETSNNDYIVGGQSVLIDAMAAANELRCIAPDLFDILCKTEATFLKERHDADMVSPKSHIVIDPTYDQVVEINWSPPFEGPLQIHPNVAVEDYVLAYQAMECILDYDDSSINDDKGCSTLLPQYLENILQDYAKQNTWEYSLQKGDILVFNNQRMLHGRRSFASFGNARRHLIGCYTDAMDTISQYRLLLRERDDKIGGGYGRRNPGNGCRWM